MTTVLRDPDSERALLSTLMLSPQLLVGVLTDERLRPEHFSSSTYGAALEAMVALSDRGEHPDVLTLAAELERLGVDDGRLLAERLAGFPAEPGSHRGYARRIRDLHRRRELKLAAALIDQAADLGDPDKLAEGERVLTTPDESEPSTWSGGQLAERYAKRLQSSAPEAFPLPFEKLNRWMGGGLRRKQIVLIGGYSSHGKSVLFDQFLDHLAGQGLRVHSYINEMSEEERVDRAVARISGVPFSAVYARRMTPDQHATVLKSLTRIRVGLTECAGWTAHEIARHIRWNHWDVAGVDIVHEIAHREERDLAEIAQVLRSAAKQAGCVLVACVHLNDQRVTSSKRPVPVLRDIRGSGMLHRGADHVLFVHRDDDEDGMPQNTGVLVAPKIRNGQPNAMGVVFDGERMRFVPRTGGVG